MTHRSGATIKAWRSRLPRTRIDPILFSLAVPPLLWAGNIAIGRAVNAQVPPMTLALARQVVALIALLPFGWVAMRKDLHSYWRYRWQIVRLSLSGMVAFNALVYLGLHDTSASNAQLLNSSIPVLIILFSSLCQRHRISILQTAGIALSCAGVLTIIFRGDPHRLSSLQFSRGDLAVFGGMASFALFSIWLRTFPREVDRLGLLGAQIVVAIVMLMPLAIVEYRFGYHTHWTIAGSAAMLYVGIAAGLLANLLYMSGVARVGAARAGLFIHLVPLYGVVISVSFLGETVHFYHAIGMAAIVGGLAFSQRRDRSSRREVENHTLVP